MTRGRRSCATRVLAIGEAMSNSYVSTEGTNMEEVARRACTATIVPSCTYLLHWYLWHISVRASIRCMSREFACITSSYWSTAFPVAHRVTRRR